MDSMNLSDSDSIMSMASRQSNGRQVINAQVTDIPGFELFTEYTIVNGDVYRFNKVKPWVGVHKKYVQLCQSGKIEKLYMSTINDMFSNNIFKSLSHQLSADTKDFNDQIRKVSDIPKYEQFTEYTIISGNIYRFNKAKAWMGVDNKYVKLSQNGEIMSLYKSTVDGLLSESSNGAGGQGPATQWKRMTEPIETSNVPLYKKMRKYFKDYRISNRGQIQKSIDRVWTNVPYGKTNSIFIPEDNEEFQIDRDDLDTAEECDPENELTQYSIMCLVEYYFDYDDIELDLETLA